MKPKNLILIFIFGLFLFLLPNVAEAACPISCHNLYIIIAGYSGYWCHWSHPYTVDGVERIGLTGESNAENLTEHQNESSCSSSKGNCKHSGFPAATNGEECTGKDGKWHTLGLYCDYYECDKTGVWDASESQCVECVGGIKTFIIGNTTCISNVCDNIDDCPFIDKGRCESACGAAAACDEVAVGGSCGTGKTCDSNCQCVTVDQCPSGDCCDTTSHPYQYRLSTYVCRASAGDCDIEEKCTGSSADCPSNSYRPSTYVCRASAGVCDIEEKCTGSSTDCPSNSYRPSTYVCDDQYDTDYGCPDGTACGYDVGVRYKTRKCPGDGTDCSGTISGWGSYTTYDNCSSTETCTDNDSTCNYTASCAPCECTGWTNQSCGYSGCSCDAYHMGQTRTCTPSGCDIECQCICDESCCTAWTNDACGAGGCAATEMHQTRGCGTCSYATSRCISDPSCGGVVSINPPVVITIANPTVSEDPSHPGKYRAILTGFLDSLGYVPGTCPNCKCIVWFKWGTSGSYGNSNTPVEMTTEDDYFYYTADNLDPGTTYYFEAFAKNGGSW